MGIVKGARSMMAGVTPVFGTIVRVRFIIFFLHALGACRSTKLHAQQNFYMHQTILKSETPEEHYFAIKQYLQTCLTVYPAQRNMLSI